VKQLEDDYVLYSYGFVLFTYQILCMLAQAS